MVIISEIVLALPKCDGVWRHRRTKTAHVQTFCIDCMQDIDVSSV